MKTYLTLFLFTTFSLFVSAQLYTDWERNTDIELLAAEPLLHTDSEGNVILLRGINFGGSNNGNFALAKYTATGTKLWEVEGEDYMPGFNVYGLALDSDDNIIMVGDELLQTMYYGRSYIMKVSSDGEVLWHKFLTNVTDWSERLRHVATDAEQQYLHHGNTIQPEF